MVGRPDYRPQYAPSSNGGSPGVSSFNSGPVYQPQFVPSTNGTGSGASSGPRNLMLSIEDLPLAVATTPLLRFRLQRDIDFTAGGAGSADAGTGASATSALRIRKNGAANGTVTFTGTSGAISFTNSSYASGDLFELYPPSSVDSSLNDVSITFETN